MLQRKGQFAPHCLSRSPVLLCVYRLIERDRGESERPGLFSALRPEQKALMDKKKDLSLSLSLSLSRTRRGAKTVPLGAEFIGRAVRREPLTH